MQTCSFTGKHSAFFPSLSPSNPFAVSINKNDAPRPGFERCLTQTSDRGLEETLLLSIPPFLPLDPAPPSSLAPKSMKESLLNATN